MTSVLLTANLVHGDIRDIRGPIQIPAALPWLSYGALALSAVLLLLFTAALIRALRRRVANPYEQARQRVQRASQKIASERPDQLAEQVSQAVREYVESRFGIRASHRTTDEFLSELVIRADTQLSSYRAELEQFLGTCDVAKFAGQTLPEARLRELCSDALRFIDAAENEQRGQGQT